MNKIFTKLLVVLAFSFLASSVFAQSGVGKISGKIIDADTQEELIGANIIILGTNLGAATDIEGNYFILNITPGTYDVKAVVGDWQVINFLVNVYMIQFE